MAALNILPSFCLWLTGVSLALAQSDVSAELEPIRAKYHLPGLSAMAIKDGRILAQGAAGVRRIGQTNRLTVADKVNIGSCTKWMTATIAARLVDRGLIRWDTRIRDLFPEYKGFHTAFSEATLDQILAHRAGIQQGLTFESRHWNQLMAQNGTISQIRRWVADTVLTEPPEVSPGEFLYSNQGYTVAAVMLETATGKLWEDLMVDEVFTPLRLESASLGLSYGAALPPKAPVGHDLAQGQTQAVPRAPMDAGTRLRYQAATAPGGFVVCTLQDWTKFLHAHATSDISDYLTTASAERLQKPFIGAEGYGRGVVAVDRSWATPGQALSHDGDIFGEGAVVWMAPARNLIVVVFTNCRSEGSEVPLGMDEVAGLLVGRYAGAFAKGPWLEQPRMGRIRADAGKLALELQTLPGVKYLLESSTALENWTVIPGAIESPAGSFLQTYIETNPLAPKFYRLRLSGDAN